jgi:hypothetical protein
MTVMAGIAAPLCANAAPLTPAQENLAAAIYSLDTSSALLPLLYGSDPTYPDFTFTGTFGASGFGWTTTSTYLGSALNLSVTGVYSSALNTTDWTGTGSYAGQAWSTSGAF